LDDTSRDIVAEHSKPDKMRFYDRCKGKNIQLSSDHTEANRTASYNQAIVFSHAPLKSVDGVRAVEITITKHNESHWSGSLSVGLVANHPSSYDPNSRPRDLDDSWVLDDDDVIVNGTVQKSEYGDVNQLSTNDVIRIVVDADGNLRFFFNGKDQGVAASNLPIFGEFYAVVELYGLCEGVSISGAADPSFNGMCFFICEEDQLIVLS
jgi:neuralized-like protein 4